MDEVAVALTLRLQQVQARLGVVPPPPPPVDDEQCVVCMDALKSHAVMPCLHQCVCEACAQQLLEQGTQSCPVCRGPIEAIGQVFT